MRPWRSIRSGHGRAVLGLLGACLLLLTSVMPASAAVTMQGAVKRWKVVSIAAASTGGARVACPKGYRVTAGGAYFAVGTGTSTFLSASIPVANGKAWYAAGHNAESGLPADLTIVVWCLPLSKTGEYVAIQAVAGLDGSGTSGTYVTCPLGYRIVTGGAIWQIPGDPPSPSVAATTYLGGTSPTLQGDGWFGAGRQATPTAARLRVLALCRPKASVGKLTTVTQDLTNGTGNTGLFLACPTGYRVLSVGAFAHAPGQGPDLEHAGSTYLRSVTPTTDGKGAYVAAYAINELLTVAIHCRPRT